MSETGQTKLVDNMSKVLRPLNFIGGIGAIAIAVIFCWNYPNVHTVVNMFFTALLGLLLLAGEFNLDAINRNCKFLATFIGRGLYDIFVGGWVYGLWDGLKADTIEKTIGLIVWIALFVLGFFFIAMHFFGRSKYIYPIDK